MGRDLLVLALGALAAQAACSLTSDLSGLSEGTGAAAIGGASASGPGGGGVAGAGVSAGSGGAGGIGGGAAGSGATAGSGGTGGQLDAYTEAVLTDGPVAWWRLDDTTTPVALDSGPSGYDGTYLAGVVVDQPGIAGTSALFDGAQGRVETLDVLDFEDGATFSIEAWINTTDTEGFIAGKLMHDGMSFHGWMLVYNDTTGFRFHRHGSTSVAGAIGVAPPGTWAHVVGTFDGATARLYVNGALADLKDNQQPTVMNHDEPFTIAMGDNWGRLGGSIDEVAVYDHALTPTRVEAHYTAATR